MNNDSINPPALADTFDGYNNDAFLSGNNQIDSLLAGYDWTGTLHQAATNITYTITGPTIHNFDQDLNGALAAWERVANVHFTYVPSSSSAAANADIVINDDTNFPQTSPTQFNLGSVSFSGFVTALTHTQLTLDTNIPSEPSANSDALIIQAMIRFVGFALGLKDPENYNSATSQLDGLGPYLPTTAATWDNTAMSSVPGSNATDANPPQTPMPYDIEAIQWLYGANTNYSPQTYKIDGSLTAQTVWDPIGSSTFDSTEYSGNATINLKQGMESTFGSSIYAIAFGTHIATLDTGTGNDSILGNNFGDDIKAGPGNDTIFGGSGNDTIIASTGSSILHGGKGNNILTGGYGNDTIFGEMGNNTMTGGTGLANLYEFPDTNGPTGNDKIENFNPNGDILAFSSQIFSSTAQAYASLSAAGVMHLIDGGTITLVGITHFNLSLSNFEIL